MRLLLPHSGRWKHVRPKAPPITGSHWLTSDPVDLSITRGRVTVVVFWSLSCEASWEHLHRLEALDREYGERLAVVAVHSPRFEFEQDVDLLEAAIIREGLGLAVVHDPELETWSRYSPPGWPSTVVIDHRSRVVGLNTGVGSSQLIREVVDVTSLSALGARSRRRNDAPMPIADTVLREPLVGSPTTDPGQLSWPAGITLIDHDRFAVVDAGHDRVIEFRLDDDHRRAHVACSYGGIDGPDSIAALGDGMLAVSQPRDGRVIGIDRSSGDVEVLVDELIRPRGLTIDHDGSLVIADSVAERLLRFVPEDQTPNPGQAPTVGPIAGTGFSGHADGPAERAELNQPVAVVRTPAGIAFIDAATSSLRILTDKGQVLTTTATPPHEPGLVDGPVFKARLQRPSALAPRQDGSLAIADAGNNRIRILADRKLTTVAVAGLANPQALVALGNGRLLIADTGNHRLVVVDPENHQVWPLELCGQGAQPVPSVPSFLGA